MAESRAQNHAHHGHGGVAVPLARHDELPERTPAQKHASPADQRHAKKVPQPVRVRDRLTAKAQIEFSKQQVAREHRRDQCEAAPEQVRIPKNHGIAQPARHAKAASLCQRANHKPARKGDQQRRAHGTRAALRGRKQRRRQQRQRQ